MLGTIVLNENLLAAKEIHCLLAVVFLSVWTE